MGTEIKAARSLRCLERRLGRSLRREAEPGIRRLPNSLPYETGVGLVETTSPPGGPGCARRHDPRTRPGVDVDTHEVVGRRIQAGQAEDLVRRRLGIVERDPHSVHRDLDGRSPCLAWRHSVSRCVLFSFQARMFRLADADVEPWAPVPEWR